MRRYPDGAEVRDASGQAHQFDAVVIATHPDQALTLLEPATRAEREVLGAFRYTPNPALLHTDARLLPDRAAVRAFWNYQLGHCQAGRTESNDSIRISYHLNRLQHLPAGQDYIVTLNAQAAVDPDRIISRMDYAHPAYTPASGRRSAPPARAEHPGHRVRRRLSRLGFSRGRLPVRRPGGPRSGGTW